MEVMAEAIPLPRGLPSVRQYLRRNFGVIAGAKSTEVCLKFSPEVADWIAEQIWHKGQKLSRNEDGTLCLRFPVADFFEVRREILRFGSSVEVLSPAALRQEIKKEIQKMARLYR
jgi:predicted DNA-binding transcriptional regulator YafY